MDVSVSMAVSVARMLSLTSAIVSSAPPTIIHSSDKRLWIFNWPQNTSGSDKADINIFYYQTQSGKYKVTDGDGTDAEDPDSRDTWQTDIGFREIYPLKSPSRNMYLCLASGRYCNTCLYEMAGVIQLKGDSIYFNYPAFIDKQEVEDSMSYLAIEGRYEDIEPMTFDIHTQTLQFTYRTDDLTPIPREEKEKQKRISGKFIFNGTRFIKHGN